MTTYTLRSGSPARTRVDLVVIGVTRSTKGGLVPATGAEDVAAAFGRRFRPLLESLDFDGAAGSAVRLPAGNAIASGQLLAVGLGEDRALTPEDVRRAAGVAARHAANASSVALALPADEPELVGAAAQGFASGAYSYKGQRSGPQQAGVADVVILSPIARRQAAQSALADARLLDDATRFARDWVNDPPNMLTPEVFAEQIVSSTRRIKGLKATITDADGLAELGCGGILAVGNGSANRPALVRMDWVPDEPVASLALIGKGVTYDSGGLTIKPSASMPRMKNDMAGAAAVVAAMHVIARRALPIRVTAWLPLAENSISGTAMRPGDVITTVSGRTVEIRNTDAEGRLILADAFTLAAREEPDALLNVATLTGPAVVALGPKVAALYGDDLTVAALEEAARVTGELVWRLPITDQVRRSVRTESTVADLLQYNYVRWGSSNYAAGFLEAFTEDLPWAHLDIAGPAWNNGSPWGHVPSGATGFGASTVVEYVAALAGA